MCSCDRARQPAAIASLPHLPARPGPGLRCWCGGTCLCHSFIHVIAKVSTP